MSLKSIASKAAPKGFRWVFCRYRKVRGKSAKVLDVYWLKLDLVLLLHRT